MIRGMATLAGYLALGTAVVSGNVVVPPPSGVGYAPQAISFEGFPGGIALNDVSCSFGPVSGNWGTIASMGFLDAEMNPVWAGTVAQPFAPVSGQIILVPAGSVTLTL